MCLLLPCYKRYASLDLTYQVIDLNCLIRLPINIDISLINSQRALFICEINVRIDQSKLILLHLKSSLRLLTCDVPFQN